MSLLCSFMTTLYVERLRLTSDSMCIVDILVLWHVGDLLDAFHNVQTCEILNWNVYVLVHDIVGDNCEFPQCGTGRDRWLCIRQSDLVRRFNTWLSRSRFILLRNHVDVATQIIRFFHVGRPLVRYFHQRARICTQLDVCRSRQIRLVPFAFPVIETNLFVAQPRIICRHFVGPTFCKQMKNVTNTNVET